MTQNNTDVPRRAAVVLGDLAERSAAQALDQAETIALQAMTRLAEVAPQSPTVAGLGRGFSLFRRLTTRVPPIAGRVVAVTTFFGLRLAAEAAHTARQVIAETADFMNEDITLFQEK